ncbi:MAG: RNase adapter RapZ [Bacillales bacterium]|nr:RNase adapter RapZ [Bacillales bacterium]
MDEHLFCKNTEVVIITGMSGAGKSVAVRCFEDLGFYCVDNLPPALLPKFLELMRESGCDYTRIAAVMDLRGREFFEQLSGVIKEIKEKPELDIEILFLDSNDETLIKRYKETRRAHPLALTDLPIKGIEQERALLSDLKDQAKFIINTSDLKPKDLREKITKKFSAENHHPFQVHIMSFGFKHGIPIDSDLVFDVRFLPNPFYIDEMRPQTGLDEEVYNYVMKFDDTKEFLDKLINLLDFMLPQYQKEGKSQLVIAIGCTGGQHRSVSIAEFLNNHFKNNYPSSVSHRDVEKKKVTLHE